MPFCEHCGTKLEDDTAFCPKCGVAAGSYEGGSGSYAPPAPSWQSPAPQLFTPTYQPPAPTYQSPQPQYAGPRSYGGANVIGVWGYIFMFIITAIPGLNLLMLLIWSFGSSNPNKRNFARAVLLLMILFIGAGVAFFMLYPEIQVRQIQIP
ncbi:hypothetical protein FACS1894204_01090 [Synergistales bacterium]|nr:hypothetical protein FACS1894204_01090 [Synergistales bacterium]